jgi:hypothetical protein
VSTEKVQSRSWTAPRGRVAGRAGTTQVELTCGPVTGDSAVSIVRQWCQARAIPAAAVSRVTRLVEEAISYGVRFAPRSASLGIGWLARGRVWVDITWRDCSEGAASSSTDLERTAAVFETLSEAWGFRAHKAGQTHWFVIDTRGR